ncbi:SCO family protein [Mesorhizobium sp. B2-2-4]|uniref:SCO family protein n=1 Tax=unclassified Mesorhizobium TaxID=325217 RepID=UPI001129875C|nr:MULTISPECIES: SCO family protein [unclassified Mesorhizobium]TPM55035.1 SCO family protein [Mesorhizobium sp. B2-2-4]TPM66003.1 SCO family protein [Mesorhizobium sp. B2-2-1]TPN59363.1 SCO family protein [Mesorhizobium sp. B1-1-4]TPN63352.1 SCO family protein [Mesorhizobium sp. B1-1-3]
MYKDASPLMRFILIGILVLMAVGIGAMTVKSYLPLYGGEPYGAAFTLVDQKGAPITEAAFRGHPSVVFFGFTHCPEVCPTTLFELSGWLKTLGDDGKNLHAYFVSVDPERDTPAVMNAYVSNFSDRITGISGDPDKVHAMAKSFGIYWKKVDTGDGDYTMDHTASVLLLNGKGDFAGTIAYGESADTAVEKLKRLAAKG